MPKRKQATKSERIKSSPERPPRDEAEVVASVQLKEVRMVDSATKLTIIDKELIVSLNVQVGHAVAELPSTDDKTIFGIVVQLVVTAHPEGKPSGSSSIFIAAKVECLYESSLKLNEAEMSGMGAIGTMTAWPQLRDFVLSMSSRMGQPPIVLPVLFLDRTKGELRMLTRDQ